MISRKYFYKAKNWIGKTSSGIAIHTSLSKAKESALNELIERHVVLKAHALNIKPCEIDASKILNRFKIPDFVKLKFFYWYGPFKKKIVVLQIGVKEGAYYSFGCDKKLDKALEKAFLEGTGMMIHAYFDKNKNRGKQKSEFVTLDRIQQYHRYEKDIKTTNLFIECPIKVPCIDIDLNYRDIYYNILDKPNFINEKLPFYAVKCVSPLMQQLFIDYWKKENINPMAIDISDENLPKELHIVA